MRYRIVFEPGVTGVQLQGNIDEKIGGVLTEIRPQVRTPRVVFDLSHVNLVNSIGIATWLAHMRAFDDVRVVFTRAPYTFVSLCKIIPQLLEKRVLASFEVRYACEQCHDDDYEIVLAERGETLALGAFKTLPCPRCKGPMTVDPSDEELLELFRESAAPEPD